MKYVKPIAIALMLLALDLILLALLITPAVVAIAFVFAKWDEKPSADSNGQHADVIRGDLPAWAWWWSTPNERLPGGTYEPAVSAVLDRHGRFWCSLYWLGWRNRMQGLAASFGVPVQGPWPPEPGLYDNGPLWWWRKEIQLKVGWRTYLIGTTWFAVPCFTFTKA